MKKLLYIFLLVFVLSGILSSCIGGNDNIAAQTTESSLTSSPTAETIPDNSIAFVFSENEKLNYETLCHQNVFLQMKNKGYNVSEFIINEEENLTDTLNLIETSGADYVILTSRYFISSALEYKQNNNSQLTIIQYGECNADSIFTYDIKLFEYYYLAGIVLGSQSQSKLGGFIAQYPDEQTVGCINAFALGMKAADEDAMVIVRWTNDSLSEDNFNRLVNELSSIQCDVFAYNIESSNIESVFESAAMPYASLCSDASQDTSTHFAIKPVISPESYYRSIIASQAASSYGFEYLGIAEGTINYELSPSLPDDIKISLESAYSGLSNGAYNVFTGPIYNELGLIIPEGVTLPDEDILDMLWLVDNVIGEIPAG